MLRNWWDCGLGWVHRVRLVLFVGTLFGYVASVRVAHADQAPTEKKVAVGFSNLVARLDLDKDEIGFAKPQFRVFILEALRDAGFNAVGAENLVFDKDEADKADLLLGGTVKELDCRTVGWQLRCGVGIEWQLLDRERDEVVYRVLSRFAALELPRNNDTAVGKALTMGALSSLLRRPQFRKLLDEKRLALPNDAEYSAATFARCDAKPHELPADFDAVADGTVLVKSAAGFGSGFFLGPDGLVVTAAHVVASGKVEVRLRGGERVAGRVVRISHKQDVALIALSGAKPGARPCLALEPTPQTAGTDVYAIGSPASEELAFSLSRGIVSGVRTIGDVPLIQTDASLSPGNSGGALVDRQGRVVGVVSRKIAGRAVEGLGFAIPIETALTALRLEPSDTTNPALLPPGPAAAETAAPTKALTDTPDPMPSLDPEGDRQRLLFQDYQDRLRERKARTPAYVLPMRWGGCAVGAVGGLVALVTSTENKSTMTHSEYRDLRLRNDLGWVALVLGSSAFVASYVLEPGLPPSELASARTWSIGAGPGNVRMSVTF